jgi:hypothetical protein
MGIIAEFFSGSLEGSQGTPAELIGKVFQKLNSITAEFITKISSESQPEKRNYDELTRESNNSNRYVSDAYDTVSFL